MTGFLVLLLASLVIIWLLYADAKARPSVSPSTWVVVVWAVIYASRSVTSWFSAPGQGSGSPESYDESHPVEAIIYMSLIVTGLIVLWRRRVHPSAVLDGNRWFAIFYLFWLISFLWSDDPVITVKRIVKDLGNVVMTLVILTGRDPADAVKAAFVRAAYVCVPISVVLIRYFPDLGRVYVGYNLDELMYVGVTTQKNSLGVLALVASLFLLWDLGQASGFPRGVAAKTLWAGRASVLLMSWYLLIIADSATSLVCAILGSLLLLALARRSARQGPWRVEAFGLGAFLALWIFDSFLGIKEAFIRSLGRDMSLTTRTDIWPILLRYQDNPLVGAGFNSFWAGRRLVQLHDSVGGIIQAHNGYLETYLNGGLVGVGLLAVLLIAGYRQARRASVRGAPDGGLRFVLIILAIIHNFTEASFNKLSILWLATVFALMDYRALPRTPVTTPVAGPRSHPAGTTRS
jgi:exopolysaccharide production protein ExoQ